MRKAILVGAILAAGCIDTDPAVFVDASLASPSLAVAGGGLGVTLSGSFRLDLHLGKRASGPSDVTFTSFSLKTADESAVLVESLPVVPTQASPVEVAPGSDVTVTFAIDSGADTLPASVKDQICAGQVRISGVIEDSLESQSSPVLSEPFTPTGC